MAKAATFGFLGKKHSKETRQKMRKAWENRTPMSDETRRRISESMKGKKRPVAVKEKIAESMKGTNNPFFGRFHSLESKKKMSESGKTRTRPKHSKETRKKMSESAIGHSVSEESRRKTSEANRVISKLRWQNPEYRNKTIKAIMSAQHTAPNKPEQKLARFLDNRFPGEWKFVGDGSVIFNGYNPDFINVNGRKLIIELFGDYWHKGEDPADRAKLFEPYGFRTLVIWEHELKNLLAVGSRVGEFQNG